MRIAAKVVQTPQAFVALKGVQDYINAANEKLQSYAIMRSLDFDTLDSDFSSDASYEMDSTTATIIGAALFLAGGVGGAVNVGVNVARTTAIAAAEAARGAAKAAREAADLAKDRAAKSIGSSSRSKANADAKKADDAAKQAEDRVGSYDAAVTKLENNVAAPDQAASVIGAGACS